MARLAALPGVQSVSLNRVFVGRGIITLLDQGRTAVEPVLRLFVKTFEESIAGAQTIMSAASHGATALGTLALMLAVIGLYGVMAWSVVQRTREIGIRMALGAQAHNVLALVLRQGMKLVLIGLIIGIPASLAVARVLSSMLIGLTTSDALTIWSRNSPTDGSDSARMLFTRAPRNESRSAEDAQIRVSWPNGPTYRTF